jgi:hypothetical protein
MVPSVEKAWTQPVMHLGGKIGPSSGCVSPAYGLASSEHCVNIFDFGKQLSGWYRICKSDSDDLQE